MTKHCCEEMDSAIAFDCSRHSDVYDCPDVLVNYIEKYDEYGLIIHDGGRSSREIKYCPWCGFHLPASRRDEWFKKLEILGFDDPSEQNIPAKFNSNAWYKNT